MSRYSARPCALFALLSGLATLVGLTPARSQTPFSVTTRSYNSQRTGANSNETFLNTSNVNSSKFGMLFSRPVDGEVYAQPLYLPNLNIAGGTHNVLFVATMHDSIYAFDADSPTASTPLWKTSYLSTIDGVNAPPVTTTSIPTSDVGWNCGNYKDIAVEIGIIGSPVIDTTTNTMYFVVRTKETGGPAGTYVQRLHAVNIFTGLDRVAPIVITASYPNSSGGTVVFDPLIENQRSALLLDHGTLYIAWASHCDTGNYHGWVMSYNPTTLGLKNVFCSTPDGWAGGVWASGQGIAADAAGNIYVVCGNGDSSKRSGGTGYGNSLVKLTPTTGTYPAAFTIADWFMPYNTDTYLNPADLDSACGPTLVPGPSGKTYVIMGGKNGWAYICDSSNLGKFNPNNAGSPQNDYQIVSSFQVANAHLHGSAAYYLGPTGTFMYLWGEYSALRAFPFNGTTFASTPATQTPYNAPNGMPGGTMTISSNGITAGTGIVWANLPWNGDANQAVVPGVLRAFDATDMTKELWNSHQSVARDDFGNYAKYCPPVVTNGKVYMATFSNQVVAYGILPAPLAASNLTATGGASAIGLNWTAGPYATSYNIKRSLSSAGTYTTIATGVTTNSYTDSGLINGTRYYYKVSATNYLGTSGDSNIASAVPVQPVIGNGNGVNGDYYTDPGNGTHFGTLTYGRTDTTINFPFNGASPAPGVPASNFSVRWTGQVMSPITGVVTFTATADDGVRLWVNGQLLVDAWIDQGPTAYSNTIALTAGQKYDLKMEYYQGGGGSSAYLTWSYPGQADTPVPQTQLYSTPPAPYTPTNLAAAAGNQQIGLTWNAAPYAATYTLKRSLSSAGTYTTIATGLTGLYYTNTGLTNGTTYYYKVVAVNATGTSGDSNIASATPQQGIASGDGLLASYYSGDDTNFTPETGTAFLQTVDKTVNFNVDNAVNFTALNWDTGVPHDDFTAVWTGYILPPVTGSYTFATYTDDGVRLSLDTGSGLTAIINNASYHGPTEDDSAGISLVAGRKYPVKLEFFQGTGGATMQLLWNYPGQPQQVIPQAQLFTGNGTVPAAPTNLAASPLDKAVQLNWSTAAGAASYNVKRSLTTGGPYTTAASGVTGTTYTDTGLTNGTTYYYVVSGSSSAGEGANSNQASAAPANPRLLVRYNFENGPQGVSPGVISDVSGSGNNGQMVGGDAGFTTDKYQGAYAAVVNTGVYPALPANFNFGDQFTVFTYAKMPDNPYIQTIVSNQAAGGATGGFSLYVNDYNDQSHALVFEVNSGGANNVQTKVRTAANVFPLGDNKYHAVAVTVNRTLGVVNFYVDGQQYPSSGVTQTNYSTQGAQTRIGVFTDGFGLDGGAKFDDFQAYAGMLSPADIAALSAGNAKVTGRLALDGIGDFSIINPGANAGTFTFDFRAPGTTNVLYSTTGKLTNTGAGSPYGAYSLTGIPAGTYDVAVKGSKNLRVIAPNIAVVAAASVPNLTLPGGDADNNNLVDIGDFGILVNAYGGDVSLAGSGYDSRADFDDNGVVDIGDFGILVNNYGTSGAN